MPCGYQLRICMGTFPRSLTCTMVGNTTGIIFGEKRGQPNRTTAAEFASRCACCTTALAGTFYCSAVIRDDLSLVIYWRHPYARRDRRKSKQSEQHRCQKYGPIRRTLPSHYSGESTRKLDVVEPFHSVRILFGRLSVSKLCYDGLCFLLVDGRMCSSKCCATMRKQASFSKTALTQPG